MTIIAIQGGWMAADSMITAAGGLQYFDVRPKIVRALDGSLVGAAGAVVDTDAIRQWAAAGMDFSNVPSLRYPKEDDAEGAVWLWLRMDGSAWRYGADFRGEPVANPYSIGFSVACYFVEGAMAAGASAERAVRLATDRCAGVGGQVQVERLRVALKKGK